MTTTQNTPDALKASFYIGSHGNLCDPDLVENTTPLMDASKFANGVKLPTKPVDDAELLRGNVKLQFKNGTAKCAVGGNRFVNTDSNAKMILEEELNCSLPDVNVIGVDGITVLDISPGRDSAASQDSGFSDRSSDIEASGTFQNGTFGKIRLASVLTQVCLAIFISSGGNFGAGLIIDMCQTWDVFKRVPELFYLIPALLGLKGNLEMTMVARLSTQANLGQINTWNRLIRAMTVNISLVQCQAIVISFLASIATFVAALIENYRATGAFFFSDESGSHEADFYTKLLVIFSTANLTSNVACFLSSIFMILMIVLMANYKMNPDNYATAIAASVGDVVTSYLLGVSGEAIFKATVYSTNTEVTIDGVSTWMRAGQDMKSPTLALGIILFFIVCFPFLAWVTSTNKSTRRILFGVWAWIPILISMFVSFIAGICLRFGASAFTLMALFQPLINGVGGNLSAITTSRLSTELNIQSKRRTISVADIGNDENGRKRSFLSILSYTTRTFLRWDQQNQLMVVFVGISIIMQIIYGGLLPVFNAQHRSIVTLLFYVLYIVVCTLQVLILLLATRYLVNLMWYTGKDPDTTVIPLLTSAGDFIGTVFLLAIFNLLSLFNDTSASAPLLEDQNITLVENLFQQVTTVAGVELTTVLV